MKLFDNHNHSQFSFDGKRTTVEKSAEAAFDKGLSGICFTDHYDFFVPEAKAEHENKVPEIFDIDAQQAEIDRVNCIFMKSATGKQFRIFKGIEIGMQYSCREKIRELLKQNQFDQVIASVHYIDKSDPFYGGYYEGKDWKTAYGQYLETIYKEMTWLVDFDIMGHFDYVTRYAPYPQTSIMYRDFSDMFDQMLKYLAEEGKALEINTKTYQEHKGRTPMLDKNILIRFRELGGEAISLGSDSHDPFRTGENFPLFAEMIKNLGFRYLAHFESRKLCMSRL